MKKIVLIRFVVFFILLQGTRAQNTIHNYVKTDGPDKNPMKGWNSGWWNDFEHASVGFQYIKWNVFEPTEANYDFDAVEDIINRAGSTGRHVILRLFTDWYGQDPISDGAPSWLASTYGVERFQYTNEDGNTKYITNYNHPDYINKALLAIQALANHYDDDPRIYTFQLGVLGYWGEWHTSSFDDPNFDIAYNTKTQILDGYKNHFINKHLMGRYPWREPLNNDETIGYHNDFFKPNNGHSDSFDDAIFANNKWLNGPIGGEIPPVDSDELTAFNNDLFGTTTGMSMIEQGHYSTMQSGGNTSPCINNSNSPNCQGFMAMHRKMGYNFQIDSALFSETVSLSENLSVELDIENIGVAPIYYNWDVQFALLDNNNQVVEVFDVIYDLRTILADQNIYTISMSSPLNTITSGNYNLGIRLIQPNADHDKPESWELDARNTYILFSNELTVINGEWNSNNALTGGWSILGNIDVEDTTLSINDLELAKSSIQLYPNPSNKNLNITNSENITLDSIDVFDITGRKIYTKNLKEMTLNIETIDISNLSSGTYLAVISSEYGLVKRRFIKK